MILELLRIIVGTIVVFFLPGFVWSYLLLEQERKPDDSPQTKFFHAIERIAVSIALSLVLVPLTTFLINIVADIGPSIEDTIVIISIPTILGIILLILRKKGVFEQIRIKLETIWPKKKT